MINRDEKLTIEKILLLTTLFVQPFFAYAQTAKQDWTKRWSTEAKGGWGYMIPCDEYAQELIRTHHSSVNTTSYSVFLPSLWDYSLLTTIASNFKKKILHIFLARDI